MLVQNGSLETIGNLSAPSIYTLAEEGPVDIDYLPTVQVELPVADTLSTTPPLPLPTSLLVTTPSTPPAQDGELLFEPTGSIRTDYLPTVQEELPAANILSITPPSSSPSPDREFDSPVLNCFKLFEYDNATKSWTPAG